MSYIETSEQFSIKNASQGRPNKKRDCDMATLKKQPRNLIQSELEELIKSREKNHYFEAEVA